MYYLFIAISKTNEGKNEAANLFSIEWVINTQYLKFASPPGQLLFSLSENNGQFWQCPTNIHNPYSSSQLLDLFDVSSIVYGQVGCVDSVYGVFLGSKRLEKALLCIKVVPIHICMV